MMLNEGGKVAHQIDMAHSMREIFGEELQSTSKDVL
jgi:hypothetical protein